MKLIFSSLLLTLVMSALGHDTLRMAADLSKFRNAPPSQPERGFDLQGVVSATIQANFFLLTDDSGGTIMEYMTNSSPAHVGDRIRIQGRTILRAKDAHVPQTTNLTIIGRQEVPPLSDADIRGIRSGRFDNRRIRVTGLVIDATIDEIAGECGLIVLYDKGLTISAAISGADKTWLTGLVGAKVSVNGVCAPRIGGYRIFHRRGITVWKKDITMLETAAVGAQRTKDIHDLRLSDYETIGDTWERMHVTGVVTAVWARNRVLVQAADGWISQVFLAGGQALPRVGQCIKAVGFPETDLFTINLSAAFWKPVADLALAEAQPVNISIRKLIIQDTDTRYLKIPFHGKPVRLRGKVLNLPTEDFNEPVIHLDCDGFIVSVDISALHESLTDLSVGCTVEITGICLLETENGRPSTPFPRISGPRILLRRPADITILTRPPWFTPGRLLGVILSLFVALAAIFIWNRMLQRLVERRSRQLYKEKLARTASELRVQERTRLAVELHDAMSQNISSAALQINAAERLSETDPVKERHHLQIAAKTLQSCREELRNCIWDLRNQSFDEPDLTKLITRMLNVHVGHANLTVRFNVPRKKLSDNLVHAILKTIRELATNALRHGHAQSVKIAGTLADGKLYFSVTDDGTGFDPDNCPGIREGHFGLQGIRERVRQFKGETVIESTIGVGTKVKITLEAADPASQRNNRE